MDQQALKKMWEQSRDGSTATPEEWSLQLQAIYEAGQGLHETLAFLHGSRPDLETFLNKMQESSGNVAASVADTLSAADLHFFDRQGYVILHNAVSPKACENTRRAITDHLAVNMNDPQTWYALNNLNHGLMVPLYQHAALEENRRSPEIRKAFEQLYNSVSIHPVIDKVSFNPPETDNYKFAGSPLHWDVSLAQPIPFKLQGLLYLSDCEATAGAFHCVPGFHNTIGEWLARVPAGIHPRDFAAQTLSPTAIPGKAGDLIIWHQALPHCATPNKGKLPRLVQYITYDPDDYTGQGEWI